MTLFTEIRSQMKAKEDLHQLNDYHAIMYIAGSFAVTFGVIFPLLSIPYYFLVSQIVADELGMASSLKLIDWSLIFTVFGGALVGLVTVIRRRKKK